MCTLTHAAETTPLWLLHNNVHVTHATATLNMAMSRTKVRNFWQKSNLFLCFQSISFLLQVIFQQLSFFVLQGLN